MSDLVIKALTTENDKLCGLLAEARKASEKFTALLETIDNRAMAGDGPVTPTRIEATDKELRQLYLLAKAITAPPEPRDCPSCTLLGQNLERGEGTHLEGTRQHPVTPELQSKEKP